MQTDVLAPKILKVKTFTLYLLAILTTFYISIGIFHLICPFDQHFDTVTYAKYWKIVDGYMGRRMSVFVPIWLLVFILNLVLFFSSWRRSPIFWILLSCFILLMLNILFTIKEQIPINNYFQSLDVNNLTSEQISKVQGFRDQTGENFSVRGAMVVVIFLLIISTPYLYRKQRQKL